MRHGGWFTYSVLSLGKVNVYLKYLFLYLFKMMLIKFLTLVGVLIKESYSLYETTQIYCCYCKVEKRYNNKK